MAAPLTREQVAKLVPQDVHKVLRRVMLVDGFDLVCIVVLCFFNHIISLPALKKEPQGGKPLNFNG
jgi:hypothetical protein